MASCFHNILTTQFPMKQVNGAEQNISSLHLWPYIVEYEKEVKVIKLSGPKNIKNTITFTSMIKPIK